MKMPAGRHQLGTDRGRILLHTYRDGLASQAGHDLTIEAARWSGELTVTDKLVLAGIEVRIDMGSLVVRDGSGGLKPLTDRDKREIGVTARKVLGADRNREATFTATKFEPGSSGGGVISGTLTLAGAARPLRLEVSETGPGAYRARTSVVQTAYGIKPYRAFLGSLKVRDAVEVEIEIEIDLTGAPEAQA
jgi:polyisoprenoid-binding protein YceI